MKKNGKCVFSAKRARNLARRRTLARMRLRALKKLPETVALAIAGLAPNPRAIPVGFDPELLYVECSRCGSPVLWEEGRATRLLLQAGIDPLELDASCMLVTDACPACSRQSEYTVRVFRICGPEQLPPKLGHA